MARTAATPYPVDVSGLTPDQQFQAGLFCGSVYATPTTPISPTWRESVSAQPVRLQFVNIPAPGTENDDHNPPRIGHGICSTWPWGRTTFFTLTGINGACDLLPST